MTDSAAQILIKNPPPPMVFRGALNFLPTCSPETLCFQGVSAR